MPGLAAAGTPVPRVKYVRVKYIIGPVLTMPSADGTIHALLGRLRAFDLNPSVRQVGTALEFIVDAVIAPDLLDQLITRAGRFAIHADVTKVPDCPPPQEGMVCAPDLSGERFHTMATTPALTSAHLTGAETTTDATGAPALALAFNAEGTAALTTLTTARTGEVLALRLDGAVVSAPRVMSPIAGGSAILQGDGLDPALWAAILNQPPLPEALTIYERREVPAP